MKPPQKTTIRERKASTKIERAILKLCRDTGMPYREAKTTIISALHVAPKDMEEHRKLDEYCKALSRCEYDRDQT